VRTSALVAQVEWSLLSMYEWVRAGRRCDCARMCFGRCVMVKGEMHSYDEYEICIG